jgi:hypothetical protein
MRKSAIKQAMREIQEQRVELNHLECYLKQLAAGKKSPVYKGMSKEEIEEILTGCQGSAADLSMEMEERQQDITSCCNDGF